VRHHHTPQHPARATHPRPADPDTTAQARKYLAAIAHECPLPGLCGLENVMGFYGSVVTLKLPDITPETVSRVLLAAVSAGFGGTNILRAISTADTQPDANDALALLAAYAGRMYLNATGQTETEA
jgi:hypothetical protein